MNASSIQSPSKATLDQIDEILKSGKVTFGPIFAFDAERLQLVFVHIVQAKLEHWRVEHCPTREDYELRVRQYLEAALSATEDVRAAMAAAHRASPRH